MDTDLAGLSLFACDDIHIRSPYQGVARPGSPACDGLSEAYIGFPKKAIALHKNSVLKAQNRGHSYFQKLILDPLLVGRQNAFGHVLLLVEPGCEQGGDQPGSL